MQPPGAGYYPGKKRCTRGLRRRLLDNMRAFRLLAYASSLLLILLTSFVLLQCSKTTEPEQLGNRVYLGEVNVTAGQRFALPVYVENNVDLGAINIPLDFNSTYLQCDSVSFVDTRVSHFFFKVFSVSDTTPQILIGAIDSAAGAPPGRGLIANAWFWAYGYAPDTSIEVWSPINVNAGLNLGFRDTSLTGGPIIPDFQSGMINIARQ